MSSARERNVQRTHYVSCKSAAVEPAAFRAITAPDVTSPYLATGEGDEQRVEKAIGVFGIVRFSRSDWNTRKGMGNLCLKREGSSEQQGTKCNTTQHDSRANRA